MFLRCSYFWRTFQPRIILIKQECNFTLCCCQFCKLTLNKIIKMRYNTANVVNLNSKYYGTYRHAEGRLFIWHFILKYFFCPSKVWSMLNHGPVWASSEQNKISLTPTLTLTLDLPLFFMIKFVFFSWFLRLYHFYSLFTAYFLRGENVS